MDEDPSRIDTPRLIMGLIAGDDQALSTYLSRHQPMLLNWASTAIRCAGLARSEWLPEDIVDQVMTDIFQAGTGGLRKPITSKADFMNEFERVMNQTLRDAKDREAALKRGGPGRSRRSVDARNRPDRRGGGRAPGHQQNDIELNQLASPARPVEEQILAQDELSKLLSRVSDPQLRQIITLMADGNTPDEVAAKIRADVRTVRRKLQTLRTYLTDSQDRR